MNKETARYIIIRFPNLLTADERMAIRNSMSLQKLGDKDRRSSPHAEFMWKRGLLTDNPVVLDLLKYGYDAFELRACERIMAECPEKVFFNYCPQCKRLARTPYARQCRYCGHDWHEIIAGKFMLYSSVSITRRGFFILGEITEGDARTGQFLDLTMLGLVRKPKINSIEYAIKDAAGQPTSYIGFGTDELDEEEMNYIREQGSFGTPLDILKER
ncbi:hypothetical protein [Mucilaginibacter gotjawali]|uniref:Uncharacterized protein n=2 Tax=Mucilaginibacter gotjawali TaxID=1550579 RepID=A0A110B075_9SPHI|nr:hypothetical protein [Mucilaginibacter gotjawali]MBB3057898.1 hypothetical protein [Mucilaginibacter gotjawali]BAU52330.1 hypothetical protein MgSA37_00485 [Mucilaginibacter gotjawali]